MMQWFEQGAEAYRRALRAQGRSAEIDDLARHFPGGAYACPCCLKPFDLGSLTREHVPPELAGGVELLLTCAACNGGSGRLWDTPASQFQALNDAIFGHGSTPARAALEVGGSPIRGDLRFDGQAHDFRLVPRVNNPAVADQAADSLRQNINTNTEFRFQVGGANGIDAAAAMWGWIRAAYLAAFAVFGYRYALLDEVTPIRGQLADPQAVDAPMIAIATTAASGARRMHQISEPTRGLRIDFGHVIVILPCPESPRGVHEIVADMQNEDVRNAVASVPVTGQIRAIAWPTEPRYEQDQ